MSDKQQAFRQCAFIADLAAARGLVDLKQAALLFDSIHVVNTPEGKFDSQVRDAPFPGTSRNDLEWLSERGLLHSVEDPSASYREKQICEYLLLGSAAEERARQLSNIVPRYSARMFDAGVRHQRAIPLVFGSDFEDVRLSGNKEIVSFVPVNEEAYGLATAVVMAYVPVPDPLTSWEAILDFRQDTANRRDFANFRAYILKQARSEKQPAELRDEIELDFLNLQASLARCRIKYRTRMVETIVVSAVSVIENILKIRFSELVKPFFQLTRSHLEYLEEEARHAEHSLYYVVKLSEASGK